MTNAGKTTATTPRARTRGIQARSEDLAGRYLTFSMNDQDYGISVDRAREIVGVLPILPAPEMPPHIRGVVKLREKTIPILDMHLKLGVPEAACTDETCIIVADVGTLVGVVVDTVKEVADIRDEDIEPWPPPSASVEDTKYVMGMCSIDDRATILLDINRIVPGEDEIRVLDAPAEA